MARSTLIPVSGNYNKVELQLLTYFENEFRTHSLMEDMWEIGISQILTFRIVTPCGLVGRHQRSLKHAVSILRTKVWNLETAILTAD